MGVAGVGVDDQDSRDVSCRLGVNRVAIRTRQALTATHRHPLCDARRVGIQRGQKVRSRQHLVALHVLAPEIYPTERRRERHHQVYVERRGKGLVAIRDVLQRVTDDEPAHGMPHQVDRLGAERVVHAPSKVVRNLLDASGVAVRLTRVAGDDRHRTTAAWPLSRNIYPVRVILVVRHWVGIRQREPLAGEHAARAAPVAGRVETLRTSQAPVGISVHEHDGDDRAQRCADHLRGGLSRNRGDATGQHGHDRQGYSPLATGELATFLWWQRATSLPLLGWMMFVCARFC